MLNVSVSNIFVLMYLFPKFCQNIIIFIVFSKWGNIMDNKIGDRILEVRSRRNLTQEELAEKVGSVASYISNIERKNKLPSLSLLRKIVKELDTSYDYLLMDDFEIDKQL